MCILIIQGMHPKIITIGQLLEQTMANFHLSFLLLHYGRLYQFSLNHSLLILSKRNIKTFYFIIRNNHVSASPHTTMPCACQSKLLMTPHFNPYSAPLLFRFAQRWKSKSVKKQTYNIKGVVQSVCKLSVCFTFLCPKY